jgi:puromycin-sensitive aminopeptidase
MRGVMAKVAQLLEKIVPERYQLHFDVDMEAFTFKGQETVEFELKQPSRELVFHAKGLEIASTMLDEGTKAAETSMSEEGSTVTFQFDDEVAEGKHTLALEYSGEIQDSLHGFYRSRYERDGQEKWIATTQFEAIHSREAFVVIDEPSAKAVFEISLTVPDQLTALANTNVVSEEPADPAGQSGRKKVNFAPTPKMSTYLVAFVIGEFEYVESSTPEGVTVRVYATPGQKGQLGFALETAVRSLSFYNEYFGIPYPLPKLDMIGLPDFGAGAMENWGLVTYRESALLLDPAKTSLVNKQWVAEVVAHELAHQWFGNLVTMAWWDDLWLNEGFATWVASLAKNHLFPDWHIWTQFIEENFARAQDMDSLANTHPIQVPVDDPRALDEIFDAISYAKGASVINMLHHYLGADDFKQGLHEYLSTHQYGNAVTHDLWSALGRAGGKPVDEVMSAWTSHAGFPLLRFEDGQVAQQRFYASPREAEKAKGAEAERWPVPFSALLANGKETAQLLVEEAAADLPEAVTRSPWFKPNPGQTAFYRTLYTEPMIEALTKHLKDGALVATDRFGVVSDVFATVEAGLLDSNVGLQLTAALREETDYVVWGAVTGGFMSIVGMTEDDALRERLEAFGKWLVQPNLKRLGWEKLEGEPAFDTLMRPIVLQQAVRFGDEDVTHEARKRFKHYLEGGPLNPDMRSVVLYAAGRYGDKDDYDAMLERYRAEENVQTKLSLLAGLGRFRKKNLIEHYLAFGLSDDVRAQDIYLVIAHSFHNREARVMAWAWLKENWDVLVKRYGAGGHMIERFPVYAASAFATHEMAEAIREFFAAHPHPSITRPVAQAVEAVELKADWYQRDQDKIARFMDQWEAKQK